MQVTIAEVGGGDFLPPQISKHFTCVLEEYILTSIP